MNIRHAAATIVAGALIAAGAAVPSLAAMQHARFSDAPVYTGAPNLPVTLSMIVAGGGPSDFNSAKLVGVLAGADTSAEVAKLTKQFGGANVTSFLTVFNFVVNDSLAKVTAAKVPLPSQPDPSPTDGKALSGALYNLGTLPSGGWDVEYMLDHLVTHPIHVAVMNDIDAKYGRKADANYHAVLTQAMQDLKSAYGL
ncbi:MAG: hypothetical protein ACREM2_07830 [Vulcanimicrobiaceae bacterium]